MSADTGNASASTSSKPSGKTNILDLKPDDSFIISEHPTHGVLLREGIIEGSLSVPLSDAQVVSQALNERCRAYGVGKLFWIPSRGTRQYATEQGLGRNGADIVWVPWQWSDIDNHLYDDATPYERLKATNAWTCLPPRTIVLAIFNSGKAKPGGTTCFPRQGVSDKYEFSSVSILLLWDDFPNMAYRESVQGINLDALKPYIPAQKRRQHRIKNTEVVVRKLHDMWKSKRSNGSYRRVSMEQVYADALLPGERKNQTLARIVWKTK